MRHAALRWPMAWAEDRATQRCDPSADPGAETGAGAKPRFAPLPSLPLRDRHQCVKPSRPEAATSSAGCRSSIANRPNQEFQFTGNQYTNLCELAGLHSDAR
jgi:hypothetical protein